MRPTRCPACSREFERRPLLQAEARHLAATASEVRAAAHVDEDLTEYHANGHERLCGES